MRRLPDIEMRQSVPASGLFRADDSHELGTAVSTTARTGRRNGAGDVVAVDLMEARRLRVALRLAVGIRQRTAAMLAAGQAPVDPVAVRVVRDDEDVPLRTLRDADREQQAATAGEEGPHDEHDRVEGALGTQTVKMRQNG